MISYAVIFKGLGFLSSPIYFNGVKEERSALKTTGPAVVPIHKLFL